MKQQFNTQEECLLYLEKLRWNKKVICPYCFSEKTIKTKNEPGRHFCYNCVTSFSVLVGSVFEDTRLNLPTWIAIIKAMQKSKNIIPAQTISENFSITIKTAWLTAMKIRCAMIDNNTSLHGLCSIDDTYIKTKLKSKKLSKYFSESEAKQKGIQKLSAIRKGKDSGGLMPVNLIGVLKHYIRHDKKQTATMRSYDAMDKAIEQLSHKHSELQKSSGKQSLKEDDWTVIKNSIYKENKTISAKYLLFYLLEYEYKLKRKGTKNIFLQFMKGLFSEESKSIIVNNSIVKKQLAYA